MILELNKQEILSIHKPININLSIRYKAYKFITSTNKILI